MATYSNAKMHMEHLSNVNLIFATGYSPTIEPTGIVMLAGGVAYAQFVRSLDTSCISDKLLVG